MLASKRNTKVNSVLVGSVSVSVVSVSRSKNTIEKSTRATIVKASGLIIVEQKCFKFDNLRVKIIII